MNNDLEIKRRNLKVLEERAAAYPSDSAPPFLLEAVENLREQVQQPPPPVLISNVPLTEQQETILQHLYQGYERVLVEREFGGGYSGTRIFLIQPIREDGRRTARMVAKLGLALELRTERDKFAQYVGPDLPSCVARVQGYYEQGDQAGLSYTLVDGGTLGKQAVTLEEYYRNALPDTERVVSTLRGLLSSDENVGKMWYSQKMPLTCFFAAEYGQHLVEHLRLRLRQASSDALWSINRNRPPATVTDYRRMEIDAIPRECEMIQPGTLLLVEGMVVKRIKHDLVKLQGPSSQRVITPDSQGIVVSVELTPESAVSGNPELGAQVGVCGEVIYNRHGRMEQVVAAAFPSLSTALGNECIELPDVSGEYPNPLCLYPAMLTRTLEGEQCYVHGDLHLRNVLVDKKGNGWLIDFAKVTERHNLFDFIKLETYVRLMALGREDAVSTFGLDDYIQFEKVLSDATLRVESGATCPDNPHLQSACHVILGVRQIAQKYMGPGSSFQTEYFPALFLYCLAVMKYYQENAPEPTRLAFATACVLGRYISGPDDLHSPETTDSRLGRVSASELSLVRELNVVLTPDTISPPVQTRLQHLPLNELTWKQFEALCAALIEVSPSTIECHLYGVQGDEQHGIDIIATQRSADNDETWAYQCKRRKKFTPGELEQAVAEMTYPADHYVLMLSIPATSTLRAALQKGTKLSGFLWDAGDITRKLKNCPGIVEDFFGVAWRKAFCG